MKSKNLFYGVVVVFTLVIAYVSLNNLYMKGVKDCTKNYDVGYCKQVMSE